jgi:hypothetical protein
MLSEYGSHVLSFSLIREARYYSTNCDTACQSGMFHSFLRPFYSRSALLQYQLRHCLSIRHVPFFSPALIFEKRVITVPIATLPVNPVCSILFSGPYIREARYYSTNCDTACQSGMFHSFLRPFYSTLR